MEIWGFCPTCRRWFYCPTWFDRDQPPPRCPVCSADPTAIENRAMVHLSETAVQSERRD